MLDTTTPPAVNVPAKSVEPGTPPPYEVGERCQVLVGLPSRTGCVRHVWQNAVVLGCDQPPHARRFVVTVATAQSIHSVYANSRVYCNADGRGEEIRPLVDSWPAL